MRKKLTGQDRSEIRARRQGGETLASIQRDFDHVTVEAIRYHCRDIGRPISVNLRLKGGKLDVAHAFDMRIKGAPLKDIASVYGVTKQAVCVAFRRHGLQAEINRMLEARA